MREWMDVLQAAGNLHNLRHAKFQGAGRRLLPTLGSFVSSNDSALQSAALRCLQVRTLLLLGSRVSASRSICSLQLTAAAVGRCC